jgi:hypothetical protein
MTWNEYDRLKARSAALDATQYTLSPERYEARKALVAAKARVAAKRADLARWADDGGAASAFAGSINTFYHKGGKS